MITEKIETSEIIRFSGLSTRIEVSSEASDGAFNVLVIAVDPSRGAPPHISKEEDKYFQVLEGVFELVAAGTRYRMERGDSLSVQRGDAHGFINVGSETGHLLLVSSPARHAEFFRDMAALSVPHEPQQVAAVCHKHRQILIDA